MGFDSKNQSTANSKPLKIVKLVSERNDKNEITGKFFKVSVKNPQTNKYDEEIMKNPKGYPLPFFGYLKNVKLDLDNKINKADGSVVSFPVIKFIFNDDDGDIYLLDLPFTSDKGRVNSNVFSVLNSMASIQNFGYMKVYIIPNTDDKGVTSYSLNIRNHENWSNSTKDYKEFLKPNDSTLKDITRVTWKYKYTEIPPTEVEKEVDGEKVTIKNIKKHQQFFIDIVNNEILPKLNVNQQQNTPPPTQTSTPQKVDKTYVDEEESDDLPF